MHAEMWKASENHFNRYVNFKIFRGGAKTTFGRVFLSKRIAYGISRTILIVGKSQDHAIRTVEWLMKPIEHGSLWAQTYGLKKGRKWTSSDLEIIHEAEGCTIRVIAIGITGSTRGINVDDYRPDLIMVDDPCDEENTATAEGRGKMEQLFFGSLANSLAPESECPEATMMLLQTPLEEGDLTDICTRDPQWITLSYGCLTSMDDNISESTWPERWSKKVLLEGKAAAIARNQLSMWLRENMCVMTSKELQTFDQEWLEYWTVLPERARYVAAIDPAPVLSDKMRAKAVNQQTTDFQAIMVKAYYKGRAYVVEYMQARDQDPDMVCNTMDQWNRKYPILRWGVEGTAYQRTLKWFIERQMKAGKLLPKRIQELPAIGDKFQRIVQAHTDRASNGMLYVHRDHTDFISQFTQYGPGAKYRDLLDVSAMCDAVMSPALESFIDGDYEEVGYGDVVKPLEYRRGCP